MGVSLDQWRVRIGLYGGSRSSKVLSHVKGGGLSTLLMCLQVGAVLLVLLIIGGVELNPGPFPCKLCSTVPETIASSVHHQRIHSLSRNFEFFCPVELCMFKTTSYGSLRYHVYMFHRAARHVDPAASTRIVCPYVVNEISCSYSTTSLWDFVQHLCKHLREDKIHVQCPIQGCTFSNYFKLDTTFRVHLSQLHPGWKAEGCPKERLKVNDDPVPVVDGALGDMIIEEDDFFDSDHEQCLNFDEGFNADLLNDELIYDSIAKFYLNLYAVDLLPASLIQKICDDITFLSEIVQARLDLILSTKLKKLGVEEDKRKAICYDMKVADPLFVMHHKTMPGPSLTSDYFRKKYFATNFGYVPPVEVNLNEDDVTSDDKYQYIAPTETLRILLEDSSIQEEIDASFLQQPKDSNIISDYTSGSQFLSEDHPPREIHLFVYQDAVNAVMNALGSAKKKYKMLNMYFTLGNFQPHIRARVDTKYAILMVRESIFKKYGAEKCFDRVITEFKKLETEGILYKGREKIKVVVQFMLGDNLGQHTVGGFIECFSADYFCRFCEITKEPFRANPHLTGAQRTVEDYEQCVQEAKRTGEHCKGVKHNSPFNSLKHIHATSHLVPCLAHDLFEGVVSWDLAGIIRHFVKKKYFSYELLNRRIANFQCTGGDIPNKPAFVPDSGKKLGGHAVQNWTMLRLFPFIIGDKITDLEDPGWLLYLQLKELSEYFTAPSHKKTALPFVQDVLIPEYFERRALVLTAKRYRLKPKHHFMAHLAGLYLRYGSLLYLWTMSYEQKHKFFKEVMRNCKNFINPEATCAIRYQLNFCCVTSGPLISKGCEEKQPKHLTSCDFNSELMQFLEKLNLEDDWRYSKSVSFNRLTYTVNDLLLLSSEEDSIQAAFIKAIGTRLDSIFFVLEAAQAKKSPEEGVYYLPSRSSGSYSWKSALDLAHPVSHSVYVHRGKQCFSLKYHLG